MKQEVYIPVANYDYATAVDNRLVELGYAKALNIPIDVRMIFGGSTRPDGVTHSTSSSTDSLKNRPGNRALRFSLEDLYKGDVVARLSGTIEQAPQKEMVRVNGDYANCEATYKGIKVGCTFFSTEEVARLAEKSETIMNNPQFRGMVIACRGHDHARVVWGRLASLGYRAVDGTPANAFAITARPNGEANWVSHSKGPKTKKSWLGGDLARKNSLSLVTINDLWDEKFPEERMIADSSGGVFTSDGQFLMEGTSVSPQTLRRVNDIIRSLSPDANQQG